ncbi:putative rna-directed dna polymerase from transposon bs [Trichonephila clavipes]|nr:putative rna-directed dna polymerase from transposon bs [Trichonephila clavipes]
MELQTDLESLSERNQRSALNLVEKILRNGSAEDAIKNAGTRAFSSIFSISYPVRKKSIVLQWIPCHCNISGNEKADRLAEAGSLMTPPDSPLPPRNVKRLIYSKLRINSLLQYGDVAAGKRWNIVLNKSGRILSYLPRSVGVACFRLLTGHDYLQRHLHCIGVKDTACCPQCHQGEMDGDHPPQTLSYCFNVFCRQPYRGNFDSFLLRHHFIGLLVD